MRMSRLVQVAITVCATLLLIPSAPLRGEGSEWINAQGAGIKGSLVDLVGPLAVIKTSRGTMVVDVRMQKGPQLEILAQFQENQEKLSATWGEEKKGFVGALRKRLVSLQDDRLKAFDTTSRPRPRLLLLYYSARWCGPCHQFTPSLVKAYDQLKKALGDEIELVFVSRDNDQAEQLAYMREYSMKWPAIDWRDAHSLPFVREIEGPGIPSLVLVTASGDVLYHSYQKETYLGPETVLERVALLAPLLLEARSQRPAFYHSLALLRHQRSNVGKDCSPSVYSITVDRSKFAGMKMNDFAIKVRISTEGRARSVSADDSVPTPIVNLLDRESEKWLFLPALQKGSPVETTVTVPIKWSQLVGT